jgi:hypothetical protein
MFRAAPCSMGKAGLKKVQLTNQPTRACTTGPSITAVRTTDRSIIVVRTGGLPITGVRIGGDGRPGGHHYPQSGSLSGAGERHRTGRKGQGCLQHR